MSGFQSPQLLTDLYRDLRDRRLLPLVLVLVVGIAVVPIALSSSSETPPVPPPLPTQASAKSNAPAEQIVVSDPGVRDYKRRLDGHLPKDPFVQEFTAPVGVPGDVGGTTSADSSAAGTTSTGSTAAAPPAPTAPPSGGGTVPETQSKFYIYHLKLRTGQVGEELKTRDSVAPLTPLPSKAVPAVTFLGVTLDKSFSAKTAVFLVSSAVSSVDGTGTCTFAGTYCQLLTLKPGQHEDLVWSNGLAYRVELLGFDLITRDQPSSPGGDSGPGSRVGRYFSF
jgi:hypothetical protein